MDMQRNTTLNLPSRLIDRAKAYAAENGTSVTAIVRRHLEQVVGDSDEPQDVVAAFSQGLATRRQAMGAVGARDYAELLVRLGQRGLSIPMPPAHEIDNQAESFIRVWKSA
jgi:hypothetical protein